MEIIKEDLGSYISIHLGNAKDEAIRKKAASGGVVTSLLIYMFDEKLIDAALVVAAKRDEPSTSEATIVNNRDEALSVSGSRYAFVPIKSELEKLLNTGKKIAVVGLPCEVQMIQELFKPKWKDNIRLCIGLFCGFNLSYEATEFILQKLRLEKQDLCSFEYRAGTWPRGLRIETEDGRVFNFPKSFYNILNLLFVPEGCLRCHDLFNEYSDISVGDAWYNLPDDKGYSTVVIRSEGGKQIFNAAVKKGYIAQQEIKLETLYKSHGHLIKYKKHRSRLLNNAINMIRFGWAVRLLKTLPLWLLFAISGLYRRPR